MYKPPKCWSNNVNHYKNEEGKQTTHLLPSRLYKSQQIWSLTRNLKTLSLG